MTRESATACADAMPCTEDVAFIPLMDVSRIMHGASRTTPPPPPHPPRAIYIGHQYEQYTHLDRPIVDGS